MSKKLMPIVWVDEPTHVLVEFVEIPLDSCCPHESWWRLTEWRIGTYQFRAEGPLEFVPRLEPWYDTEQATPAMLETWERFCAQHAPPAGVA